MKWYAISESELMSFHMAAVLACGENRVAQDVVNEVRAREISYTKERPANVTQHGQPKICPECNGSGLPKLVNQTNCTLCKGRGKLRA